MEVVKRLNIKGDNTPSSSEEEGSDDDTGGGGGEGCSASDELESCGLNVSS
jgi:hypothetical protein